MNKVGKIFDKIMGEKTKNDDITNCNSFKQTMIANKPVQVFNNNPTPKRNVIEKVYKKIPDNTNIPLQFMTRKQYMQRYMNNQEKKNNVDFSKEQEQCFIKKRTTHYNNITGRYTTNSNPFYPPAVVVFNDKDNFKNIKGENFEKLALHEYGHELVEKEKIKLPSKQEEYFADKISEYGQKRKIFCDNNAKNYALSKLKKIKTN